MSAKEKALIELQREIFQGVHRRPHAQDGAAA